VVAKSEKLFDVKVVSRDVFLLNGFKPGRKKDSAVGHIDIVLVLDREEARLGRDLLFLEDRARTVMAGSAPTMKVKVASNERGKLEVYSAKDGRQGSHLCTCEAVIREAQLVVTATSIRLVLTVRLQLDDVTVNLALHHKSDLHLTWTPLQVEMKLEGSPPGQAAIEPEPEPEGEQLEIEGDLPPEPGPEHAPPASPKRGRGRKP
jgi:hypothetical protein